MCIALISTSHPTYPFILLSNRDEFLLRPTAAASWWEAPHRHVLGGRDLQRSERGTWLGITAQGRLAVLTNFRDEGGDATARATSRGAMVKNWLTLPPASAETPERFAHRLRHDPASADVGGFSLAFGQLRQGRTGLALLSNRTPLSGAGLAHIAARPGEVCALSNSFYGDRTWRKVVCGEEALRAAIAASIGGGGEGRDALLERLFGVLSLDTLPREREGEAFAVFARQLRESVFVPAVGGRGAEGPAGDAVPAGTDGAGGRVSVDQGLYGTQKQTVILVDGGGAVTFVERTLYDEQARAVAKGDGDRRVSFQIEGWAQQR